MPATVARRLYAPTLVQHELTNTRHLQAFFLAGATGLEPATSGVTERRSSTEKSCIWDLRGSIGHRQVTVSVFELGAGMGSGQGRSRSRLRMLLRGPEGSAAAGRHRREPGIGAARLSASERSRPIRAEQSRWDDFEAFAALDPIDVEVGVQGEDPGDIAFFGQGDEGCVGEVHRSIGVAFHQLRGAAV